MVPLQNLSTPAPCPAEWTCDQCSAVFASKKALAVHATKQHNYRALVQHFAVGTSCPHCCRLFHQRSRLMAHLRAMPRCLAAIRACFPPLAEADLKQFAEEDAEHTRVMKMQSWFGTAMRAAGPALPPPGSPDAAAMLARWTTRRPTSCSSAPPPPRYSSSNPAA